MGTIRDIEIGHKLMIRVFQQGPEVSPMHGFAVSLGVVPPVRVSDFVGRGMRERLENSKTPCGVVRLVEIDPIDVLFVLAAVSNW